jgi:gluconate 2-dehydrogenase gamma chain
VLSAASLLTACEQADEALKEGRSFTVLSEEEAADFGAMAARIVPTDDTAGATEAGVIHFMDNVLGGVSASSLPAMREGLLMLSEAALAAYGSVSFSRLTPKQQDALLTEIEETDFFATLRYLTIAGMFSHPSHGGNRDRVGWQLLGFDDRHSWQPPFGFYDADYAEKGE